MTSISTRRGIPALLLGVAFLGVIGVAFPVPAGACSCASTPVEEYIDGAAIGRQIDRTVLNEFMDSGVLPLEVEEVNTPARDTLTTSSGPGQLAVVAAVGLAVGLVAGAVSLLILRRRDR